METAKDLVKFFKENDSYDPIRFFNWMGCKFQSDKQPAHAKYSTFISLAKATPKWKKNGEWMAEQWTQCQQDGTISNFWRQLPKESLHKSLARVQTKQALSNVKRLYKRDNVMSGILDQGLLDEVSCAVESGAVSRFEVEANDDSVDATGVKCDSSTRNSSEALDGADVESRVLNGGLVDEEELQEVEQAFTTGRSPFLPLLEYVYKKVQGRDARLPPVPSAFICQEYKELYQYAHGKLLENDKVKDKGKGKKDANKPYHVDKDVLVALSGIVNTISPSTQAFTFASEMKLDSAVTALEEKDDAVADLMDELLESYCPGHKEDPLAPLDMENLRLKIWSLLITTGATSPRTKGVRQRRAVLQVIDHICTLIATNQLTPPTTEHVVVSAWSFILAVLLGGEVVRGIPGELASPAAKNVRLHIENEYGVSTKFVRGRKVDLSVRVFANNDWHNEICVFEFKPDGASDAICSKQQRKAVRLNTAVLQDLEYKGVDVSQHFPVIAEGRGLYVNLYTLKRCGEVMVAGKATSRVAWIPSDQVKLKQFLKSDSIQILLNFAQHTSRYAVHVQETLSSLQQPPMPCTPPTRFKRPFAAFTPLKHNKRKHVDEDDEDVNEED